MLDGHAMSFDDTLETFISIALFGARVPYNDGDNPSTLISHNVTPLNLFNQNTIGSTFLSFIENSSTNLDLEKLNDVVSNALNFLILNQIVDGIEVTSTRIGVKIQINVYFTVNNFTNKKSILYNTMNSIFSITNG
jgi:hypothetical protein